MFQEPDLGYVHDWLVPRVLNQSSLDEHEEEDNCRILDSTVICVLICMLTGRYPDCDLNNQEQLSQLYSVLLAESNFQVDLWFKSIAKHNIFYSFSSEHSVATHIYTATLRHSLL